MKIITIFSIILFSLFSCTKEETDKNKSGIQGSEWLVSEEFITGGLNPFYLYDDPDYISVDEAKHLDSTQLVLVFKSRNNVYVYPYHSMLVEVVNDVIDEKYIAITFCPLTRSGICWNRVMDEDTLLLTASGYLYKDNLMPYDVKSESIWSQMLLLGTKGKFKRSRPSTFPLIETHWQNIIDHFPEAKVFFMDNWKNGTNINDVGPDTTSIIQENVSDHERILGIVGQWGVELFQFSLFTDSIKLYSHTFEKEQVLVIGSAEHYFMVAFHKKHEMTPVQNEFPVIMKDNSGTRWNIFGEAVSGPGQGRQLSSPDAYMALGWAWKDLFDRIEVYGGNWL